MIVDGALRLVFPKETVKQLAARLRDDHAKAASQVVEGTLTGMKDEKLKDEIRTTMLSAPAHVAASAFGGMADERLYEPDPIKVPLLAVLAKSPFWPADTEQFLRSLAPRLEFHMWEDVSHFLMMERPQEFNQTLQRFLSKNKLLMG